MTYTLLGFIVGYLLGGLTILISKKREREEMVNQLDVLAREAMRLNLEHERMIGELEEIKVEVERSIGNVKHQHDAVMEHKEHDEG